MSEEGIGARLRDARTQRGLGLRNVAQALGVSASLISQVETGKTRPSVSTLFALANHLGVSFDELLGIEQARLGPTLGRVPPALPAVQRASENPVIEMENGVRWERLATGSGGPADTLLVTYQPGASSSVEGKLMRHSGIEYAYIMEGELTLQLDFDTFTLGPGDSLQFDSVRPHMFSNRSARIAKGVWFIVGRHAQNRALPDAPEAVSADHAAAPTSAVGVLQRMDALRD